MVTHTAWSVTNSVSHTLQKLRQFLLSCSLDEDEDIRIITDDAMQVQFGLKLLDRTADHATIMLTVVPAVLV